MVKWDLIQVRPSITASPKAVQCGRDERGLPKRMPGLTLGTTGKPFDTNKWLNYQSKEKKQSFLYPYKF